jgi:hypothetical protein
MQVTPNEIDTVEEAGMLDGSPVKMIRTKGGFWICVGRPKGKMREEAIGAGSHPAIVKYNIEKQYPNFQPTMMKSEHFNDNTIVDKHSHFLSEDLRKSGHDIYSVQNDNEINFHITKHFLRVASVGSVLKNGSVEMDQLKFPEEFVRAISGAALEKALACGASKIKVGK